MQIRIPYDPATNPLNNNEWSFPLLEIIHIVGFAIAMGTIFMVDLRLIGIGMRRRLSSQLSKDLAPWTLGGLAAALMSGPLIFSSDPNMYGCRTELVTDCPEAEGFTEDVSAVFVAPFTLCVNTGEVLPAKLVSPPYTAVTAWLPAVSVLVANVVTPDALSAPVPSVVEPSLNVTFPVGVPAAVEVTAAVRVTDCPIVDGFSEEVTAVPVAA